MIIKSLIVSLVCLVSFTSFSQQLERMVLENWNNGTWENRMQQLPSYDEEGRLVKNEIAHWNAELSSWDDQTKTVFSRDENGILMSRETLKWMPDQSTWQSTIRANYTVNEFNKPQTVLNEVYDEGAWSNQSIEDYTYDRNGKMIERQTQRWNKHQSSWMSEKKFNYTLDSDRTIGYTIYVWDSKMGEWQPYKKAEYVFAENETIKRILYDSWVDEKWEAHSIRRNLRDDEGVLMTMEVDQFDPTSEIWSKHSHVDFDVTEFGKPAESISKKWNANSGGWENLQRSTYSYSTTGNMIEDWADNPNPIELFPNPASESLTIRSLPIGKITIVDALGKVVLHTENQEQELKLDISKWENGVYTVKINGNEIEKFVKQ